MSIRTDGRLILETSGLGHIPEHVAISLYRKLQLLTGLRNTFPKRYAFRITQWPLWELLFCLPLLSFGTTNCFLWKELLRYMPWEGCFWWLWYSPSSCTLVSAFSLMSFDNKWRLFKQSFLDGIGQKTFAYKSAFSCHKISLETSSSFRNVNRSTAVDWMDTVINRLVDVVVGTS